MASRIASPLPPTMRSIKNEEAISNVSNFIRNQDILNGQTRRRQVPGQTLSSNNSHGPTSVIESMSHINLESPDVDGNRNSRMSKILSSNIEQMGIEDASKVSKMKKSLIKEHFSDFRSGSRSIFAMICIIYAFYQIGITTITYFQYKTGVAVKEEDIIFLEKSLPGITVCNKNLIEKSSAFKYMPGFQDAIRFQVGDIDVGDVGSVSASGIEFLKEQKIKSDPVAFKKLIEVYEDFMSTYYAEMSVSRQLKDGPDMEKFLKYLDCNKKGFPEYDAQVNDIMASKFECQNKGWINTAQGKGNCITLFHKGSSMNRKSRPLDPMLETIKEEVQSFVPNEAVKIVLDFFPANYTDLRIDPGGELMIHDPRIVPLEAALSYALKPGKFYQFYVSKITTKSLKRPYASNCTDYDALFWPEYTSREVSDALQFPLSETQCEENCVIESFVKQSKCWPKAVPFWEARLFTNQKYNVTWCHRVNTSMEAKQEFFANFDKSRNVCNKQCGPDCLRNYYRTFYQEIDWPSNERIWAEKDPVKKHSLKQLKSCCALVSIAYSRPSVSINHLYPKMELISFLAEIGGIISMWIGICIASINDLFMITVDFISHRMNRV